MNDSYNNNYQNDEQNNTIKKNNGNLIYIIIYIVIAIAIIAATIVLISVIKDNKNVENNTKNDENVTETKEENENNVESNEEVSTVIIGDNKYGYITIPSNWLKFNDVDGNKSIQYTYNNAFIVSLDYVENDEYTAEVLASNYMHQLQKSTDVTNVTGTTVKIGKNSEYTAYQIYMYYPTVKKYLITYWFDGEDGLIHYIALEGPEKYDNIELADLLYIPESFSLSK